jgi:hypothetical protein
VLAKAIQAGMNYINMRNEEYDEDDDSYGDSDNDSDYNSYDDSSNGKDDDCDDFIAGVDVDNSEPPNPPDENPDETNNNDELSATLQYSDDEDVSDNVADESRVVPVVPTTLKNLTDLLFQRHSRSSRITLEPCHQSNNPERANEHWRLGRA